MNYITSEVERELETWKQKQRDNYLAVARELEKDPDLSVSKACKAVDVSEVDFYGYRKYLQSKKLLPLTEGQKHLLTLRKNRAKRVEAENESSDGGLSKKIMRILNESFTEAQRKHFLGITDIKAKNPTMNFDQIAQQYGLDPSTYYKVRQVLKNKFGILLDKSARGAPRVSETAQKRKMREKESEPKMIEMVGAPLVEEKSTLTMFIVKGSVEELAQFIRGDHQ